MGISKTEHQAEMKSFLHDSCVEMVNELQKNQVQIMEIYKVNPTYPADFYNLSLREFDSKILAIRELYKRITDEEL
ncbi:MAG: hypothetical protein E6K91_04665 [Thaumarchaeota archaeon]|nr:MAG: hypothetical protein E6K91_04665 [Nitrososphaerota archaeon]